MKGKIVLAAAVFGFCATIAVAQVSLTPVDGGYIDSRTGTFYTKTDGGAINSRTGRFVSVPEYGAVTDAKGNLVLSDRQLKNCRSGSKTKICRKWRMQQQQK